MFGDDDMYGLGEAGGRNQYLIGSGVGVATSTATALIIRRAVKDPVTGESTVKKYANGIGAVAAAAVGGAMMASSKTREIGIATIVSGVAAGLLAHVAEMISAKKKSGGWGDVVIDPTAVIEPYQGFGAAMIDPAYPVPGSINQGYGFGTTNPNVTLVGAQNVSLVGPPTLANAGDYGMGENPAVTQTKLLGGPSISALGAHYGSTVFGH